MYKILFLLSSLEYEDKQLYVKADNTVIKIKCFSSTIIRNKDNQYCNRSVLLSPV